VGMKLVGMVLNKWAPHVPDRAFRVLMRMAAIALDEDSDKAPAATFFGGRDLLASVLRAERSGTLKSQDRALTRAINDLIELGAIERTNRACAGNRAEYRLTLFGAIRIDGHAVDKSKEPDTHWYPEPDTSGQKPDTHWYPEPDTHWSKSPTPTGTPRSTEDYLGLLEEQDQEESVDLSAAVTVPRANATDDSNNNSSRKCDDPRCELGYRYDKTRPKGDRNYPCPICSPNVIPFGRRSA
jgi:hypothetical protein